VNQIIQFYSDRKAIIGSTFVARCAGIQQASSAIKTKFLSVALTLTLRQLLRHSNANTGYCGPESFCALSKSRS
jgi:hypothetical protein